MTSGAPALGSGLRRLSGLVAVAGLLVSLLPASGAAASTAPCERHVSTAGDDEGPGGLSSPWRTLQHAVDAVPDAGCTVWVAPGLYRASTQIERRFRTLTTFRASVPYMAVLESLDPVIDVDGASNVVIQGFEIRHSGPGAAGQVVNVDRSGDVWAEHIVFRDNVIHDSYDDDLLKVHNGARFVTLEGNVFYNQGPSEQHLDINSVTDVDIRDNLFFNDFEGSGRTADGETKHYIVIKDSNQSDDGQIGAERITVRRNVMLNWQGGSETLIKVGNDGMPYFEARDVLVENNLMIGNSTVPLFTPFGVSGAAQVLFRNNTVTGDHPARSYAFQVDRKDRNPVNEDIRFVNNIWSDPTGTMGGPDGVFSTLSEDDVDGFTLRSNLYWNGGRSLPAGTPLDPTEDPSGVIADPLLGPDHAGMVLPRWNGDTFTSGNRSIRGEFIRLVETYGRIPTTSPALGRSDPALSPADDVLGLPRRNGADIGAYEADAAGVVDTAACPIRIPPSGFLDLGGLSAEAIDSIDCLFFHRVARGTAYATYGPAHPVLRWQMALFLSRQLDLFRITPPVLTAPAFDDVGDLTLEARAAIGRLAATGIAEGTGPGTFHPHQTVSRWQMALFTTRVLDALGVPRSGTSPPFSDLQGLSDDAVTAIAWLDDLAVVRGTSPTAFDPHGAVTRWQMALFLARTLDTGGFVAPSLAPVTRLP